jgi:hypothetical protein
LKPPVPHKDVGPKTKLKALDWLQNRSNLHPLTCGNDSRHTNLVGGVTENGQVYMECVDCDYIQLGIPEHVWQTYISFLAAGATGAAAPFGHVRPNIGDEE